MERLIMGVFLALLLVPFSQGFSQEYSDTFPTLTASLVNETPYVYQDSEGHTVVVGEVVNKNPRTPITNVKVQATFFDRDSNILEVNQDETILEVIPPNGKSPFVIRSNSTDSDIALASASLLGFDSSAAKQKKLTVSSTGITMDLSLHFSGILKNGAAPGSDANVYLAFYDRFDPPRILEVSTVEIGDVESDAEIPFEFNGQINSKSAGFKLFSESNVFYSDFVDVKIPPSKLARISDVTVEDNMGNKLSEIKLGSTVYLKSNISIQFATDQKSNETAYTYYVQVKESGKSPKIEYLGKFDGRFIGTGTESVNIDWIPEKKGLFFIETFVWDRSNNPIAEQGPFALILVN